jgi:hypothetical protein
VVLVTRDRQLDAIRRSATVPLAVWWRVARLIANLPPPALCTAATGHALGPSKGS